MFTYLCTFPIFSLFFSASLQAVRVRRLQGQRQQLPERDPVPPAVRRRVAAGAAARGGARHNGDRQVCSTGFATASIAVLYLCLVVVAGVVCCCWCCYSRDVRAVWNVFPRFKACFLLLLLSFCLQKKAMYVRAVRNAFNGCFFFFPPFFLPSRHVLPGEGRGHLPGQRAPLLLQQGPRALRPVLVRRMRGKHQQLRDPGGVRGALRRATRRGIPPDKQG